MKYERYLGNASGAAAAKRSEKFPRIGDTFQRRDGSSWAITWVSEPFFADEDDQEDLGNFGRSGWYVVYATQRLA